MMKTFIFVLFGFLYIPSQYVETTDYCTVDGVQFKILDRDGIAVVKIKKKDAVTEQILKIKAPCYFLRSEKKIQSYSYKDINTKVIIITGHLMDDRMKEYMGAPSNMVCGQKGQGILFRNDSIIFTDTLYRNGMICKDEGLDEKDFSTFAYRTSIPK